jgi:hypothetical protein
MASSRYVLENDFRNLALHHTNSYGQKQQITWTGKYPYKKCRQEGDGCFMAMGDENENGDRDGNAKHCHK